MKWLAGCFVAALSVQAGCTVDHTVGQNLGGGAAGGGGISTGGGFCGGAGGQGGGGSGGTSPVDACDPQNPSSCQAADLHCVHTPDSACSYGYCHGWCLPMQVATGVSCGVHLPDCPTGMSCVNDPEQFCDWATTCGCTGVCYGVDLIDTPKQSSACAGDGGESCGANTHCAADPSAACAFDGGSDCAGVCIPTAQTTAAGCGPYPDFGCASGSHCVKNPNHACTLPLDCPGLCVPD